jgi:GWxTD domain-containing protein
MLNKKLIILFFLLTTLVFGQNIPKNIFFEVINMPDSIGANCIIPFKVAYDQLVFVKVDSKFVARFSMTAEATDSVTNNVKREIVEKEFSVDSFELTSSNNMFIQGLIKLELPAGKYNILLSLHDKNSNQEFSFKKVYNEITEKNKIINPIIIKSDRTNPKDSTFTLSNTNESIPFSPKSYDLLFSVGDTSVTKLTVEFSEGDSLYEKYDLEKPFSSVFTLRDFNNDIQLIPVKEGSLTKNFIIYFVNRSLKEGNYKVKVTTDKQQTRTFALSVVWFDRPKYLSNLDHSIKILKYITNPDEIEKITDVPEKQRYSALFDFWRKYDPTPNTAFNELMEEFYRRADYAVKNFSVLGSSNGDQTDRGRIYIQFGKPDEVKRIYTNSNDISEIWTYNSPNRQFVFTDRTGAGDFQLQKGI